ncbi:hypothetical protein [Aeromonas enteropelogenes]|uniref:hypothetical protein n=1 Tax=Aeromonas enteropelogenes TaxID=29489 RepID=UPI003B9E9287
MKKAMMMTAALMVAVLLSGCAASYVQYEVSGGGDCPPVVVADTAMGVSVHVNDGAPVVCKKKGDTE